MTKINEVGSVPHISSVSTPQGSKTFARLLVAKSIVGSPIEVPFAVIKGVHSGPTMWVQGVIHGDEFAGSEAIRRIIHDVNPEELSGSIIAIPIVSTTAYASHMRYSSRDGKDLDFSYTGNTEGTFSERYAELLLNEISSTLTKGDFMFDLHGSPGGTEMQPWVDYHAIGGDSEDSSRAAAEASGVRVVYKITPVKEYKGEIGSSTVLADEYLPTSSAMKILGRVKLGRVIIEAGSTVAGNEDVDVQYLGILNVMKHLKMLEGTPKIPNPQRRVYINEARRVMAKKVGFWRPVAVPGNMIAEGDPVALVTDEFGREIENLTSPVKGIVLINKPNSFVDPLSNVLGYRYGALIGF